MEKAAKKMGTESLDDEERRMLGEPIKQSGSNQHFLKHADQFVQQKSVPVAPAAKKVVAAAKQPAVAMA